MSQNFNSIPRSDGLLEAKARIGVMEYEGEIPEAIREKEVENWAKEPDLNKTLITHINDQLSADLHQSEERAQQNKLLQALAAAINTDPKLASYIDAQTKYYQNQVNLADPAKKAQFEVLKKLSEKVPLSDLVSYVLTSVLEHNSIQKQLQDRANPTNYVDNLNLTPEFYNILQAFANTEPYSRYFEIYLKIKNEREVQKIDLSNLNLDSIMLPHVYGAEAQSKKQKLEQQKQIVSNFMKQVDQKLQNIDPVLDGAGKIKQLGREILSKNSDVSLVNHLSQCPDLINFISGETAQSNSKDLKNVGKAPDSKFSDNSIVRLQVLTNAISKAGTKAEMSAIFKKLYLEMCGVIEQDNFESITGHVDIVQPDGELNQRYPEGVKAKVLDFQSYLRNVKQNLNKPSSNELPTPTNINTNQNYNTSQAA